MEFHTPANFRALWTARLRRRLNLPPQECRSWASVEHKEALGHDRQVPRAPPLVRHSTRSRSSVNGTLSSSDRLCSRTSGGPSSGAARPFDTSTEAGRSKERHRRAAMSSVIGGRRKGHRAAGDPHLRPADDPLPVTEEYGLWLTISSVIAIFGFADLGIGNGLVSAISRSQRPWGPAHRRGLHVRGRFFMLVALAGGLGAVFVAIYPRVPWARVLNVSTAAAAHDAGPTVAALVVCTLAAMPLGVVQRVQAGMQEGFATGLWQCAGAAGLAALMAAIGCRASLPWLVLATSGSRSWLSQQTAPTFSDGGTAHCGLA